MKGPIACAPFAALCAALATGCSLNPIGEDPGISNDSEMRNFEGPESESPITESTQDEGAPPPLDGSETPVTDEPMNAGGPVGAIEPSPAVPEAPGVDVPTPPPSAGEEPTDEGAGGGGIVAPGNMVIEAGVPDGGPPAEDEDDAGLDADAGAPVVDSP